MSNLLRERLVKVLTDAMAAPTPAFWDSRETERLAEAVIELLIAEPSIREMLLEELVRRFMLATATSNGEGIQEAHDLARKLLRIG